MKKRHIDLQIVARSILAGSMLFTVTQGTATASTWLKIVEFESQPYNYVIYMNSATFNRKGKTASAVVEVSGISTSGAIDKESYQYIADCSLWRYKKNSNGTWKVAAKDSASDQVNSFLCSSSRKKQTSGVNTAEKGAETRVETQIQSPHSDSIQDEVQRAELRRATIQMILEQQKQNHQIQRQLMQNSPYNSIPSVYDYMQLFK